MTERGTTGAGEPQITGIPRVYRTLEQNGCCTMGATFALATMESASGNLVNLKPLCDSEESLSHNFEPENSTCVADVGLYEPNLDDSVVNDCDVTPLRTGNASPASCTHCSVLGV